ncbi:MAG: DUF1501 domain-containing protein [Deltaproteobacteria bacterium]|nr:DUF1501 domain-containing protein [Deltaproteobacteria bacterium]
MAITRRQFITRTGLASGGLLVPAWLANPGVREARADIGNRYLVVIHLDGGNDGLNTVTPIDDGGGTLRTDYEGARDNLRIPAGSLLPIGADSATGAQLGLNPALAGVKALFDAGRCAILQGCGYPEPRLSHDGSKRAWQTGHPIVDDANVSGWIGDSLVSLGYGGTNIPAVNIGAIIAPSFEQTATSVIAVQTLDDLGFAYDLDFPADDAAKRACFATLYDEASATEQNQLAHLGSTGAAALVASESFAEGYETARASWNAAYDDLDTAPARDLREVAKVIYGVSTGAPGMEARFFHVRLDGYDTHSSQGLAVPGARHYELLRAFGDALQLFHDDCTDMGVGDELCILVWSDFGRRIQQNGNGTDHGSLAPMFVVGGSIAGGLYGAHPNITPGVLDMNGNTTYSQAPANPWRARDFRDVYGTILKHWCGLTEGTILSQVLTPEPVSFDPDLYWVDGNHGFDMAFLPPPGP